MSEVRNMRPLSLTSVLARHKGPARGNHYKIILPDLNNAVSPEELNALCRSCNIPSRTIATLERKITGTPTETGAGDNFGDLTLSFTEVTDGLVFRYWESWMDLVTPATELSNYRLDFVKEILIQRLRHDGTPAVEFKLYECWPKTRPDLEFSDESQNVVQKVTVSLSCKNYDYKVLR